jgi:hypothetical protein
VKKWTRPTAGHITGSYPESEAYMCLYASEYKIEGMREREARETVESARVQRTRCEKKEFLNQK